MHVHHERHAEQRGREIEDRDRHEGGDEHAGDEDCALVPLAQALGLRRRPEAHRGELEIFAAEEVGGGEEENDGAESREQQERHRDQINHAGEERRLHALDQRAQERQRGAHRLVGIIGAFDLDGDVVGKEARHQRGHRRHQEDGADNDTEPGDH